MESYLDSSLSPEERAELLLKELSLTEKFDQLRSYLNLDPYDTERTEYNVGHRRNIGHFLHKDKPLSPSACAAAINETTRKTVEASPHNIPPIQNGEALHGVQWCNGTCFPQSIALAATFDTQLVENVAAAIGKELRAGGVRQVFAPVVNIVRDCRWGRTEETYGEDVTLVSRTGAAFCRGLEKNNVIATPKHFADNYSDGGRDSNESHSSWRDLREIWLEPFRACFTEGGARSVMMAYNSLDGVPCSENEVLMQNILRDEWNFKGYTVSDYGGVDGVAYAHKAALDGIQAQGLCLKAGLDVDLPNGYRQLEESFKKGYINETDIDKAVRRVLKAKFELGLFESPYVNSEQADNIVHCKEHTELALEAARKSTVLLKNNGLLPLQKGKYKKIGIFGPSANNVNVGGYSGPYGGWKGDAETPFGAISAFVGDDSEIILCENDEDCERTAENCDLLLYFTATLEGEGADRCSLKLPAKRRAVQKSEKNAIIINEKTLETVNDQESVLKKLGKLQKPMCVVLINGAPVDVSDWEDGAEAILEAWYPGEMGAKAITETLFGENNPGGKLPITFPKSIGQVPLFYARKPTGRSFGYIENDGSPRWCFGYGLSYTEFEWSNMKVNSADKDGVSVSVDIANIGRLAGDEVVQMYLSQTCAAVVRPIKELKDFIRVSLAAGETKTVTLHADSRALSFYDKNMNFGIHPCKCKIILGPDSDAEKFGFEFDITQ